MPGTGEESPPAPAGHTVADAAQDAIGLAGHLGTLWLTWAQASMPGLLPTRQLSNYDLVPIGFSEAEFFSFKRFGFSQGDESVFSVYFFL